MLGATHTMFDLPSVREFHPSQWRAYKDLRLRALADSPDAFGSTLASELDRSDAQWAESLAKASISGFDLPLIAFVGTRPVGLAWAKADPTDSLTIHLFQMWVTPEHRGRGLGRLLLSTAIQWARERGAKTMLLGVTSGDTSAVRLYASAGFQAVGIPRPLRPGSLLQSQNMKLDLRGRSA
jgi:GNAT superfamily N-acetyltransferase